jgi:uncharacterized membrane protein YbhN (UPF0104 family)
MPEKNNIKEELLKQMHENPHKVMKSTQDIFTKDKLLIKRLKWITAFSWLLVVICFIITSFLDKARGFLAEDEQWLLHIITITLRPFFLIALFLTVSLYIRSRTLTIRQIQVKLSDIEEQLKKMSKEQ